MNFRLFIIPLVLFLLLIGGVVGNVFVYKELARIRTLSLEATEEIARQAAQDERAARVRTRLEQLSHDEELIKSHLVAVDDVVAFLQHIEEVATVNNATLEVVSVSNTAPEGHIDIAVKVDGTFASVMRTLGALEYDSYALSLTSVSLNQRDEDAWQATGTMTALIYTP